MGKHGRSDTQLTPSSFVDAPFVALTKVHEVGQRHARDLVNDTRGRDNVGMRLKACLHALGERNDHRVCLGGVARGLPDTCDALKDAA